MTEHLRVSHVFTAAAAALILGAGAGAANAALIVPNGSLSGALIGGTVSATSTGVWTLGVTTTKISVTDGTRVISGYVDPYWAIASNLLKTNGGVVAVGDSFNVPVAIYLVQNGPVTPFDVSVDGLSLTLTSLALFGTGLLGLAGIRNAGRR